MDECTAWVLTTGGTSLIGEPPTSTYKTFFPREMLIWVNKGPKMRQTSRSMMFSRRESIPDASSYSSSESASTVEHLKCVFLQIRREMRAGQRIIGKLKIAHIRRETWGKWGWDRPNYSMCSALSIGD